ncbi:shikimate kinase [Flavobacterium psychrophilum]|nr:shikimate kinase [Flavobacterium psychrophilum]
MKKIVLVGYMASGKTEIGKLLSKKVNLPFLDIDYLIEESLSKTVNEIFEEKGEVFFRKKNMKCLKINKFETIVYIKPWRRHAMLCRESSLFAKR